jgi:hypothetical protein
MGECLSPCPFCARHVRASEAACPFCAGALSAGWDARAVAAATPGASLNGPLTRAALLFMGAAAAAGCSEPVSVYGPGPVNEDASAVDGGSDAGSDAGPDIGSIDAGVDATRDDSGGPVAIYSAAPVRETR